MICRGHKQKGFTLIELLVVIAIIILLAAILMPALRATIDRARRTSCINNLKQTGLQLAMYENSYQMMPPWLSNLFPEYTSAKEAFVCPTDGSDGGDGSKPHWDPTQYPETDELASNQAGEQAFEQANYSKDGYTIKFGGLAAVKPHTLRNTNMDTCSYIYEYTLTRCPFSDAYGTIPDETQHKGNGDGVVSWREYKTSVEMHGMQPDGTYDNDQAYKSCVPLVRCFFHTTKDFDTEDIVLNLGGHQGVTISDPTADGWKLVCKPSTP